MAAVKFFKVLELPAEPEANSFYFVKNGDFAEHYLTDSSGVAAPVGNTEFVNGVVEDAISDALGSFNRVEIVADITARDALDENDFNFLVLVLDATDDETVDAGSALYVFRNSDDSWHKVAEYESLDLVVNWDDIVGAPSSTPAAIDSAVANAHTHANKAVLDLLTAPDGTLLYDGEPVLQWDENEW